MSTALGQLAFFWVVIFGAMVFYALLGAGLSGIANAWRWARKRLSRLRP